MRLHLALALVSSAIGCGGAANTQAKAKKARPAPGVVLPVPDKLTLYSIDGTLEDREAPYHTKPKEVFHGDPVLGKVEITDPAKRAEIIGAFGAALQNDQNWGECFWPRHALRAVTDGKTTDYVICYECGRVEISGSSGQSTKPTDRASRAVLNKYLKEAGVPLVKGAEGPPD
nr:hypothetical protein Hi04_10k_c2220_00037 [uncultured bacterium]